MINIGDQIKVTLTCIFDGEDKYLFTTQDNPLDVPFIVKRDLTDKEHNQRIDDALEQLKVVAQR